MRAIKNYDTFITIKKIHKGWSTDEKYYVETDEGNRLLLRISDVSMIDEKKHEAMMVHHFSRAGLPVAHVIDYGICGNGRKVYVLMTWCEGEDAAVVLPTLSNKQQYELGVQSGDVLRKMHDIPAPAKQEDWDVRFNRKIDLKIKEYKNCGVQMKGADAFMDYIESHRHLLENRPQTFQHGDYHTGNMVITESGTLSIIDFNRNSYGDPWEEFNRIVWSAAASPHFATGQLHGYFNGEPSDTFFQMLALYISNNTLSSIPWAIPFGEKQVHIMQRQVEDVLHWFDGMNHPIPTWYQQGEID